MLYRLLAFLGFVRNDARCGDWFEELPPDSFVREPRRPRPSSSSGGVALELPPDLELEFNNRVQIVLLGYDAAEA